MPRGIYLKIFYHLIILTYMALGNRMTPRAKLSFITQVLSKKALNSTLSSPLHFFLSKQLFQATSPPAAFNYSRSLKSSNNFIHRYLLLLLLNRRKNTFMLIKIILYLLRKTIRIKNNTIHEGTIRNNFKYITQHI